MLSATLYITVCSIRNRTRRWLRRLREPRYFFGLVAVVAYFYFAVFARIRASTAASRRRRALPAAAPLLAGAGPAIAGIALLGAAAASWLIPGSGRLFEFSGAEVQFLFPAPVPRRQLVIHRLLRSQVGLLFASIVPSLGFSLSSSRSGAGAFRTTIGVWLLLITARVYFSAVTLARSQLTAADARVRRLARMPLILLLGALLIVGAALTRAFLGQPLWPPEELLGRLSAVAGTGWSGVVLWPCLALVRPLFATTWPEHCAASLATAACVVAVAIVWVLVSDQAFYDVTTDGLERQAAPSRQQSTVYRARKTEWTLAPSGRPEGAFVWKTLMQILRVIDRRVALRFVLILLTLSILVVSASRARGFAGVLGLFAAAGAVYSVLLAPQVLRLDLRQDLQHLELLKTWPVRASAVVRGEIMGPALFLSVAVWALIGLALFLSTAAFSSASAAWRVSIAAGATLLGPTLIFGQYTIHNAMALMFPAWIALGAQRPRGVDAMGQRLLTLGGTWLALILMMLPGALPAALIWFAFYRFVGAWVIVPSSAACALVIAIEILLMTEALGPAYERLDLLAVERPD